MKNLIILPLLILLASCSSLNSALVSQLITQGDNSLCVETPVKNGIVETRMSCRVWSGYLGSNWDLTKHTRQAEQSALYAVVAALTIKQHNSFFNGRYNPQSARSVINLNGLESIYSVANELANLGLHVNLITIEDSTILHRGDIIFTTNQASNKQVYWTILSSQANVYFGKFYDPHTGKTWTGEIDGFVGAKALSW